MSSEKGPEEKGKNLELFAEMYELEEEAERLSEQTRAQVEKSLEGSGHDAERARALGRRAKEMFAKAEAEERAKKVGGGSGGGGASGGASGGEGSAVREKPPGNVVPIGERRGKTSRVVYLIPVAAAFAVLATEGSAMVAWLDERVRPGGEDSERTMVGNGADPVAAGKLRAKAAEAYAAGHPGRCVELLDEAWKLDPEGDKAPAVEELRRSAMKATEDAARD